eukprot:14438124-Ditylum_brightwellii.AAC.1
MAIEEIQLGGPSSTSLVDDNTTNEVDDDIVTWDDFVSNQYEEIAPQCGGFVLTYDDKLLVFVETDPDAKVNVFSYNLSTKKYTVDMKLLSKSYQAVKGPVNNGQYHPANLKAIKLIEEACT